MTIGEVLEEACDYIAKLSYMLETHHNNTSTKQLKKRKVLLK